MSRPTFQLPPPVKYVIPVGGLLDVSTGDYLEGIHDQLILQGGVGAITGLVGPGNSFKTTLMRYMEFSALARLYYTVPDAWGVGFDTEINAHERRNDKLARQFLPFRNLDVLAERIWQLTDMTMYDGGKFWDYIKSLGREKRENKKSPKYASPFWNRERTGPMMLMAPSFIDIDSLSKFYGADVEKMLEDTEVGDSAGNTAYMKAGLAKSRMLMEMPTTAGANLQYFLFTAHIGKEIVIPTGPTSGPPRKQLQHMPNGEIIKGVSNNFFYLLHNCWLLNSARPFLNKNTKGPEFPYTPGDETPGDLDLNMVTIKQLRGKNGGSGFTMDLLVSQREGYLPTLSELYYLKSNGNYGITGHDRAYQLELVPDETMSRTTARQKCRESVRVQRGLEITSQLAQIYQHHPMMRPMIMTPEELKKGLEAQGYDLEMILTQTRGWHTLNDDDCPGYPWSTPDLCRAARGQFHPYWLEADKKTIKAEYRKRKEATLARFAEPRRDESEAEAA